MALLSTESSYSKTDGLHLEAANQKFFQEKSYGVVEDYYDGDLKKELIDEYFSQEKEQAAIFLNAYTSAIEQLENETSELETMSQKWEQESEEITMAQKQISLMIDKESNNPYIFLEGIDKESFKNLSYDEQEKLVTTKVLGGMEAKKILDEKSVERNRLILEASEGKFSTYEEYQIRLEECRNDLAVLKASQYSMKQWEKENYYRQLSVTEEYLTYKENFLKNPPKLDAATLEKINAPGDIANQVAAHEELNEILVANSIGENTPRSFHASFYLNSIRYDYLEEEDRIMYSYLYDTKGRAAAQKYLEAIQDRINHAEAVQEADEFMKSITNERGEIDINACSAFLSATKGFEDGVENWVEGIANLFAGDGVLSTNQYVQMEILSRLSESEILSLFYDTGLAVGNMTPSILISSISPYLLPFKYASLLNMASVAIPVAGNNKELAMVDGHSEVNSLIYGAITGISYASLSYFIDKIPFFSKETGFTIKNIVEGGVSRTGQVWVEAISKAVFLDEKIDLNYVDNDSFESFVLGMAVTSTLTGTDKVLHLIIDGNNVDVHMRVIAQFFANHKKSSPLEALKVAVPAAYHSILTALFSSASGADSYVASQDPLIAKIGDTSSISNQHGRMVQDRAMQASHEPLISSFVQNRNTSSLSNQHERMVRDRAMQASHNNVQ